MIDVKSIRIGSHVTFNGRRVRIDGMDVDEDEYEYIPDLIKTSWGTAEPVEVEPIPITPELLAELGFNGELEYGAIYMWSKGDLFVEMHDKSVWFSIDGVLKPVAVRYLHDIENYLYLATQRELIADDNA